MNSRDPQWRSLQVGEYVLGTLDSNTVAQINSLLETDVELQDHVIEWQERLQPLADAVNPVTPSSAVWRHITDELGLRETQPLVFDIDRNTQRQRQRQRARIKLRTWQWIGSAALAASMLLAVALWKTQQSPIDPQHFDVVSVVGGENNAALWVIHVLLKQQTVQVTAIAPPAKDANRDYELWIVKSGDQGVRSIGLLPGEANSTVVHAVEQLPDDTIAFAVSLEPSGGSPKSEPTGPVVYQASFNRIAR